MPSAELQRICREMTTLGDTIRLTASKEGIKFQVSGDTGVGTIVLKANTDEKTPEESISALCTEEVSLTFALRYLALFTKATPLSSTVIVKLSLDVPLVLEYRLGTLGHLSFYLAPKDEHAEEPTAE